MKTLSELRNGFSLNQDELAAIFGVSSRTIQNIEKDSTNIKDSLLKKYLFFFSVKYDDIFLGNEYEKNVFLKKRKDNAVDKIKKLQEAAN